jgi:DNA-binding NarL/FixJ family response regulator
MRHTKYDLGKNNKGGAFRFLVVDDSPWVIKSLERVISNFQGEIVGTVSSAKEALAFLTSNPGRIDIITLEMHQEGNDCRLIIPEIKALDPSIKIIVLSELSNQSRVKEVLGLGANHVVEKPIVVESFFKDLCSVLLEE